MFRITTEEMYYFVMELFLFFNKYLFLVKCGKQLAGSRIRKVKRKEFAGRNNAEVKEYKIKKPVSSELFLMKLACIYNIIRRNVWQTFVAINCKRNNSMNASSRSPQKIYYGYPQPFTAAALFQHCLEPVEYFDETPQGYFEFPEGKQSAHMNTADKEFIFHR